MDEKGLDKMPLGSMLPTSSYCDFDQKLMILRLWDRKRDLGEWFSNFSDCKRCLGCHPKSSEPCIVWLKSSW
jgi:hypothetical protein